MSLSGYTGGYNPMSLDGLTTIQADTIILGDTEIQPISAVTPLVANSGVISIHPNPTFTGNVTCSGLKTGSNGEVFYSEDITTLKRLLPAEPSALLSTRTLSINASTYQAKIQNTDTIVNVTGNRRPPTNLLGPIWDARTGTVTTLINGTPEGVLDLSTNPTIPTSNLRLSIPSLAYEGTNNFWTLYNAQITAPITDLPEGVNTYQITHTFRNQSTPVLSFHVDYGRTPVISNKAVVSLPSFGGSRYVSGVRCLNGTETLSVSFTVTNYVGAYYNSSWVANASSPHCVTAVTRSASGAERITNATLNTGTLSLQISNGIGPLTFTSIDVSARSSSTTTNDTLALGATIRVDTYSSDDSRFTAGSSTYPTSGFGAAYDSTVSLTTNSELQRLGNLWRQPENVDYSTFTPTQSRDYRGTNNITRWVLFKPFTAASTSGFTINWVASGLSTGLPHSNTEYFFQVRVNGVTGWLDGNKAYSLSTPSPSADGDGCCDIANTSSIYQRRITFGATTRSGDVMIRIGLVASSTATFDTPTITNIT